MKNFKIFELKGQELSKIHGGSARTADCTVTNVSTHYTQETKNDKDSNAANENSSFTMESSFAESSAY